MCNFSIKINPNSFCGGSSGNLIGNIWLEVGDKVFPSENWSDFPVIIVGWWLENFLSITPNKSGSEVFMFMDGPFQFNLESFENTLKLKLIQRLSDREEILDEFIVTENEVANELYLITQEIIEICKIKGYDLSEMNTLLDSSNNLKKIYGFC
jgi:hypothetical protein